MSEETVLCPDCGWTGPTTRLDGGDDDWACPVCSTDIEFVD